MEEMRIISRNLRLSAPRWRTDVRETQTGFIVRGFGWGMVCVCVCVREVSYLGDNEGNVILRLCVCRVVSIQLVLGKPSPLFL